MSYTVAVRALCEFTAKVGDLDLRFTPAPSAQEGMAGHAWVAASRGAGYQAELPLAGSHGDLQVRGRADGYDEGLNRLEEIKTYKGRFEAIPENHRLLHWAQLKVYGALLCAERGLAEVELALVYFEIGQQKQTVLTERHTAQSLQAFFEQQCQRFAHWAAQEAAHRSARDAALTELRFPHAEFRQGQRHLAESVYKSALSGRCLMAEAPTGIGKTVGTLFPLLKAAPGQQLDKIFFLTAKSSGRALVLDALALIHASAPGLPLRSLELVARDKACEHPDKACHGESCPLAQGFYDRLPAARQAALAVPTLDRAALRELALSHQVCPYYLSQELARWCDVVVGDYNYFFDVSALLHGLTQAQVWRVALLVDEAHNLVERARKMYSVALSQASLRALKQQAELPAEIKRPLARLQRQWLALNKLHEGEYQRLDGLPDAWLNALQLVAAAISSYVSEHPTRLNAELQSFYFEALHFARMAEVFGAHSICDLSRPPLSSTSKLKPASTLSIRNIVPAPFLKERFAAAHCCTLFSATLQPARFYTDLLGLPDDSAWVEVESPFSADQLQVTVARRISTRFQHRRASLPAIVALMAQQYAAQPGNYLAFFSSHDYLQEVAAAFVAAHPQIEVWIQDRRMSEQAQQGFLQRLTPTSQGIAFAVLGGSFSEGIDLPGRRLIGAFIATLGLPQLNPVNEQMRQRLDELLGAGYDYTYTYPGLQKVVQAAGRVIRTVSDAGVLHLMDDRFQRPEIRALLPSWWRMAP